jgi:hypothetical protein
MSVKIKKLGNLHVLPIPNNIPITETDYEVFSGSDGSISYIPKRINPFKDPEFIKSHQIKQVEDIKGGFIGKEIPWD